MLSRKYNTKIAIYINEAVPDGYGGYTNEEVLVKSIWSNVETAKGSKFTDFGIADFKNPVIFQVRGYKNQIEFTENHFIKYKGVNYFVKGIEDVNLEGIELNIYADSE